MRAYPITVLAIAGAALVALAGTNYAVDPFNRIRPNTTGIYLKAQEREMNPGIARSLRYDTVIAGSSLMENLDPAYVRQLSGWKAVNLAVEGSTGYEQRRNVEVALRTGQVKRVIWGMDWGSFSHLPQEASPGPGVPDFLYREDSVADYAGYVFNLSVLRASFKKMAGIGVVRENELGRVHNWSDAYHYGCQAIAVSQARFRRIGAFAFTHHMSGVYARNLDANFFALVDAYPDVTFYALIPPYSAQWLHDVRQYNPRAFADYIGFRHSLAAARRPNLRVYDFMSDRELITAGKNYRDLAHYDESVNQLMFRRMLMGAPHPPDEPIDAYADLPMRCDEPLSRRAGLMQ